MARLSGAGKLMYKKVFAKIKARAVQLSNANSGQVSNPGYSSAVHFFGEAAKEFGFKGYGDVQTIAQLAGERLKTFLPTAERSPNLNELVEAVNERS